jgi:lysophospholipase L1-like esterase
MKSKTLIACLLGLFLISFVSIHHGETVDSRPRPEEFRLPDYREIPNYPFLRQDLNRIQYFGDSLAFQSIFEKLDRLIFEGGESVSIMHIGGSHVQAGTLSNRLRENFFSLAPGLKGERGFLFPFRLAHTNGPGNFKVEYTGTWDGCRCAVKKENCDWGLSGYAAHTFDSLSTVKLWSFDTDSVAYGFNRVKIYHSMDSSTSTVRLDSSMKVTSVFEDSSRQYTEFVLGQSYDTLKFEVVQLDSMQTNFTIQGIQLENDDPGISYNAIGVNGASVPSYLRCGKFQDQLATVMPDLVIFGIGINDAYGPSSRFSRENFEQNYDSLIGLIRQVNPNVSILFLTNNDSYYKRKYPNKNAIEVHQAMLNLARKYNGAVWDLFHIMGGLNSVKSWENAGLAKSDKVHFTSQGYILEADLLFNAFRESYGNYLASRYTREG